jgi:hypothetical protein
MHRTNPISSLSRRLLVGVRACERYFIGVAVLAGDTSTHSTTLQPEPNNYDNNPRTEQCRTVPRIQSDKHKLWGIGLTSTREPSEQLQWETLDCSRTEMREATSILS